jgi:hypothetical protein
VHQRCQSPGGRGLRPMGPAFAPRTITQGALARDLPETALHVTSRRLTTRPSTAPLTSVVVWARDVLRGVVNSPSINGMQGVRGSNPLSSTASDLVMGMQLGNQAEAVPQLNPSSAGSHVRQACYQAIRDRRHPARDLMRATPAAGHVPEPDPLRAPQAPQSDATGRWRATL